eukprot:IDg8353t1
MQLGSNLRIFLVADVFVQKIAGFRVVFYIVYVENSEVFVVGNDFELLFPIFKGYFVGETDLLGNIFAGPYLSND